jgi:multidrug efflux pump
MFSRFFIDRPIFASVLSIMITLGGFLAYFCLPLAQYPPVTPPVVQVNCNYPGASAQTVAETVASPIEQQVNGVENMLYMVSQCTNDGSYNLAVTFKHGVNLNLAQVLVQNRVNLALPMLPDVLRKTGVTTRKMSPDIVLSVNLNSPHGSYDQLFLSNYALMRCRDELLRIPGVSDIFLSGQRDYSMRIWIDPEKLAVRNLTAGDVVNAIREQNQQIASGQIGQPPVPQGQVTQITLTTLGRLKDPEQFANIIICTRPGGRVVRIRDVGWVELGAKSQDISAKVDGKPTVGLIIFQLPDANALDVADRIHAKMDELAKDFPEDLAYEIQYDTTPFTRECIQEVYKSLIAAVILVAFVVLLFLQNWRSALIPLLAVPVAIVGTFGVMAIMGFSLNNLTLFGLVLAIGIVVDNAIVVVEAVEYHIERGMLPREATIKAMSQVSGPVVAMGLVLSAVFVPCAFISGITGQFFRQFALTIAASTIISTFSSLTLSPALAATVLRPRGQAKQEVLPKVLYVAVGGWLAWRIFRPWLLKWIVRGALLPAGLVPHLAAAAPWVAVIAGLVLGGILGLAANRCLAWVFAAFDTGFRFATTAYIRTVSVVMRISAVLLLVYFGLLALTYWQYMITPKGFIPTQDMGFLMVGVQLPDAASAERTQEVMERVQKACMNTPGIKHLVTQAGSSFLLSANSSNFGSMFAILDSFPNREAPGMSADEITINLRNRCNQEIPEAMVTVLPAPPLRGVGRTGGFRFMVEDRGDLGLAELQKQADKLNEVGNRQKNPRNEILPLLTISPNVFRANTPQLYVDLNRPQCISMGVSLADAFDTLRIYLGSLYVNDINLFGRTWQVIVQASERFRSKIETARQLKVRNRAGTMVPIASIADIREINGPLIVTRYNMYPAAALQGQAGPGVSSRQAIDLMQELADRELPHEMHYEWTELAYLEIQAGNTAMYIFGLAVLMVFLVLAAQYESWSMPLAVILVVPTCLLSAVFGVTTVPAILRWVGDCLGHVAVPLGRLIPSGIGAPNAQIDINIFTQVGFVVLVGLASKNAILLVEFAKHRRESGESRRTAALEACKLRLRPIVMTSSAFILGVSPLLIGRGAGAEMRRTLGTAVFTGMLGVTFFGIFLTPVFFVVIDWLRTTSIFRTRAARMIGNATLNLVGGGYIRAAIRDAVAQVRNDPPNPPDSSDSSDRARSDN